jgi:hypothetical protein
LDLIIRGPVIVVFLEGIRQGCCIEGPIGEKEHNTFKRRLERKYEVLRRPQPLVPYLAKLK